MSLSGDELHDLALDENRQIQIGAEQDLELTSGIDTVTQSVAISAGRVLRPLIGETIDGQTLADIQEELRVILSRDPQISSVTGVTIESVNRSSGSVVVSVDTSYNNSFELPISVQ